MKSKKTTYTEQFEALIDNEILDLLEANNEKVGEISKEIFGENRLLLKSTKSIIESAIQEGGERRVKIIKDDVDANTPKSGTNVFEWPLNERMALIQKIASENKLTSAARNRKMNSDDELNEDLEDFIDLGLIDVDGNIL